MKHSIAQLIAVLAKHELPKTNQKMQENWPELFAFLGNCFATGAGDAFQLGLYCISVLSETAGEHIVKHRLKVRVTEIFYMA